MVKAVYEITGEELSDKEIKGVIAGCLDEITCRHTTNLHGDKYSSKELRVVVNTFISTNVRDPSAMQIGSLEAGEGSKKMKERTTSRASSMPSKEKARANVLTAVARATSRQTALHLRSLKEEEKGLQEKEEKIGRKEATKEKEAAKAAKDQ